MPLLVYATKYLIPYLFHYCYSGYFHLLMFSSCCNTLSFSPQTFEEKDYNSLLVPNIYLKPPLLKWNINIPLSCPTLVSSLLFSVELPFTDPSLCSLQNKINSVLVYFSTQEITWGKEKAGRRAKKDQSKAETKSEKTAKTYNNPGWGQWPTSEPSSDV